MDAERATANSGDGAIEQLIAAVLAGAGEPIERAQSLPPRAYISAEFFDLEVEKIFRNEWLCVGHVGQLQNIGDYVALDLLGELLVVVRAEAGIRVLSRVCLHRWTPLVNGTGNTKRFSCPFHRWSYTLDGQLLGAPLMDGIDFEPKSCRLPAFRNEIVDGFIYVTFSDTAPALGGRLSELSDILGKLKFDELIVAGTYAFDCKINWKIVVETFMEAYHHIGTHAESFEPMFPARGSYIEDGREGWTCGHVPAKAGVPDAALTSGFPDLGPWTAAERREIHFYLVYPYHLFIAMPDRVFWFCMQPRSPTLTMVQSHLLVRPEARSLAAFAEMVAHEVEINELVASEDNAINEIQQLGAASRSASPGRFSLLEKAVWQLANYVREHIRA